VEIDHGVPMFLDELLAELRLGLSANRDISITAAKHGRTLLKLGFSPSQVVHDYGDVCQSITEMAVETAARISADDFRMLNRCLDDAIASAVTQYATDRDTATSDEASRGVHRMSALIDETHTAVLAAAGAFEALQAGYVGLQGSTGRILAGRLKAIGEVNERMRLELQTGTTQPLG
jgi:hypothetical protein